MRCRRHLCLILLTVAVMAILGAGCSSRNAEDFRRTVLTMAPIGQLPLQVQRAAVAVREAYQFTVANTEVVRQIPCYCGCGAMGHTSNASCYVSDATADDRPVFDAHALGCSICVDITQDVMRKMRQGVDLAEIRSFVDATYSQYGPSNIQ